MYPYILLLRGINVGGHNKIPMTALRDMLASMGMQKVQTYVQSGNAVFYSKLEDAEQIAKLVEQQLDTVFGFQISVFCYSKEELERIYHKNRFIGTKDPTQLYVTFLSKPISPSSQQSLILPPNIEDECIIQDREIYVYCPNGYGRTKLNNNYFEKKLAVNATTRNWKTVQNLHDMISEY